MDNYDYFFMPMTGLYGNTDIENKHYKLFTKKFRYPDDFMYMFKNGIIPGDYTVLYSKDRQCVVMSDTPMERFTNQAAIDGAYGNVLILGLGIGMIIQTMCVETIKEEKSIDTITVIEKDKNLIDIIEPILRNSPYLEESGITLEIINDDAYKYPEHCNKHYDFVYADIWDEYHGYEDEADIFSEIKELYSPICNAFNGWGYDDATGDNPYGLSPIEKDSYVEYLAEMILHYKMSGYVSDEILDNIMEYMEDT